MIHQCLMVVDPFAERDDVRWLERAGSMVEHQLERKMPLLDWVVCARIELNYRSILVQYLPVTMDTYRSLS